jgi:hypothetical protein
MVARLLNIKVVSAFLLMLRMIKSLPRTSATGQAEPGPVRLTGRLRTNIPKCNIFGISLAKPKTLCDLARHRWLFDDTTGGSCPLREG